MRGQCDRNPDLVQARPFTTPPPSGRWQPPDDDPDTPLPRLLPITPIQDPALRGRADEQTEEV